MIKKHTSSTTSQEYLAIISVLISLVENHPEALDLFQSEKVVHSFIYSDRFKSSEKIREYQDDDRGVDHILWCWTLYFLGQVLLYASQSADLKHLGLFYSVVDFLIQHEPRLTRVLSSTNYNDNGNKIHKSLSYLEETQYVTALLNALFLDSRWKHGDRRYFEFYNRIVTLTLTKTLNLFSSEADILNHYKCYSATEKRMEAAVISDTNQPNNERTTIDRNFRNPFSLFYFRVSQCLDNILFYVSSIVKAAFLYESSSVRGSYINCAKETYSRGFGNGSVSIKVFDEQCRALLDALYFVLNSSERLIKNYTQAENLQNLSLLFFNNVDCSLNLGNLNLLYCEGNKSLYL